MPEFSPNERAYPTVVAGERAPETTQSVRLIADVRDEILLYMPSANPLTTITGKLRKSREVTQAKFDVLTKDQYPRKVTLAAAATAVATSLTVQAGEGARVPLRGVYRNLNTGEQVLVTNVVTDTLTVIRGIGGGAQDMAAGDALIFLRAVFADGAGKGSLKSVKEDTDYNYTEIIKTTYGFTGRQMNTSFYGGRDPMTERKWQGIEHAKSLEYMMLLGKRHLISGSSPQETFSGGVDYFITTNEWDVSDITVNERAFVEMLEHAMKWGDGGNLSGSRTKYLFHSARWGTTIEFFAKDKIQYRALEPVAGLALNKYVTAHGTVILVPTPILDEFHPDRAYLLDLNHIRKVNHQGRNTKLVKNIQANDIDGEEELYISDVGAEVTLEASHTRIFGLQ